MNALDSTVANLPTILGRYNFYQATPGAQVLLVNKARDDADWQANTPYGEVFAQLRSDCGWIVYIIQDCEAYSFATDGLEFGVNVNIPPVLNQFGRAKAREERALRGKAEAAYAYLLTLQTLPDHLKRSLTESQSAIQSICFGKCGEDS